MQTAATTVVTGEPVPAPSRAEFLGRGGEYFRIWIVNVALTLVTLGIYSPWAKVRREQYFHRNTRLAGAAFDYDARPIAILRGRILALLLLIALQLGSQLEPRLGIVGGLAFAAAFPWLVVAALRFRLHHTLHRGLRFAFRGTLGDALRAYVLWPLAGAATLGVLAPYAIQRQQQFLYGKSAFGGAQFESAIPVRAVYGIYFGTIAILVLLVGAFGAAVWLLTGGAVRDLDLSSALSIAGLLASLVLGLVAAGSYFRVRLQNLAWNHLRLGPHRFRSDQTVSSFLTLQLGNLLGIALTLGLFRPWAAVRNARYRARHTTLVPGESLDAFVAGAPQAETAAADEIAELFGFDLGF
jgi:uncharacterized membrane protein YjgN (DUF898 family)